MYPYLSLPTSTGYAVAQWLGIRLQMLGVAMVTGVSFIAVLEHHFNSVDPGRLAFSSPGLVGLVDPGMLTSSFPGLVGYHCGQCTCSMDQCSPFLPPQV